MYKEKIDRFISYFTQELELIDTISNDRKYKVHKKALYLSFIDAFSGVVYPAKSNRKRFVSLVLEFGNWEYSEYISTPHLAKLLKLNPDPKYSKLRKFTFKNYDKWSDGDLIFLNNDLQSKDVEKLWPNGKDYKEPINGIKFESLKHCNLLYSYRNSIIHEFRPFGTDAQFSDDQNPYYFNIMDLDDENRNYWSLIYPTHFFYVLANTILKNVEKYFIENRIDPIEIVMSGNYWLKGLNK